MLWLSWTDRSRRCSSRTEENRPLFEKDRKPGGACRNFPANETLYTAGTSSEIGLLYHQERKKLCLKTRQRWRQEKRSLTSIAEYADKFHNQKKEFHEGDRIPYASRVYDSREMVNLVDSSLEFWLTSGRYTDEFEKKLAEYLHVRYCALVNSGSSRKSDRIHDHLHPRFSAGAV